MHNFCGCFMGTGMIITLNYMGKIGRKLPPPKCNKSRIVYTIIEIHFSSVVRESF